MLNPISKQAISDTIMFTDIIDIVDKNKARDHSHSLALNNNTYKYYISYYMVQILNFQV